MTPSTILTILSISASVMDWTLANIPELGVLIFIGLCIWKFISWLDHKFSVIDTKFLELRSDMNLEFVKVRAEMTLLGTELRAEMHAGFAELKSEIKLINHRLDDHDKRLDDHDERLNDHDKKIPR